MSEHTAATTRDSIALMSGFHLTTIPIISPFRREPLNQAQRPPRGSLRQIISADQARMRRVKSRRPL
jgi:hypothetical protein